MASYTDSEFFEKITQGNKAAFDYVFKKYYVLLRNYAFTILKDTEAAEDSVQEVFFNIWINREQIGSVKFVNAYLRTSVHNYCISYLRKQSKLRNIKLSEFSILELDQLYTEVIQYHQDLISDKELSVFLSKSVEGLPEQCRMVFILSRSFKLKNAEIADFLNISIKTVERHITKALAQLRKDLLEYMTIMFLLLILG